MGSVVLIPVISLSLLGIIIFNSVTCDVQVDFRVTPAVVKPLETVNMILQCTVKGRNQYYNQRPWNQYYFPRPLQKIDNGSVALIRIMKNLQARVDLSQYLVFIVNQSNNNKQSTRLARCPKESIGIDWFNSFLTDVKTDKPYHFHY